MLKPFTIHFTVYWEPGLYIINHKLVPAASAADAANICAAMLYAHYPDATLITSVGRD